ncbi:glutamine synthetase family protein [Streptomyces sp. NPDC048179]|uniref:glutamine synthetase family protein n=1 Tax=Streptomyces sp. NPDC048179 TaxID=3365506 RepID=UPI0037144838
MSSVPLTSNDTPASTGHRSSSDRAALGRPAHGRFTQDELRRLVASGRIDTVALALPDLQGRLKGKLYNAGHFIDRIAASDAEMCAYVLATDADMRPAGGFALTSWEAGYGDLRARPDLSTLRGLPWMPRTALVVADAVGHDGRPLEIAPRQLLRRQLDQLADRGLHTKTGLETEFVVFQGTEAEAAQAGFRGLRPVTWANLDYALDHPPAVSKLLRSLQAGLAGAGMPVEAMKTESAHGQVEVTFPYGDTLTAADNHLVFKHAVKVFASRAGMMPVFMAAPMSGVGSGCHLHISLWQDDQPALGGPEGSLSTLGRQVVAGLLHALPDLAPLYAPNVNSYKRYLPNSFAPICFAWGRDNRTCAVRVVGHGPGLHLEVRLPGADTNPYLVLAAVLAAAEFGIDRELAPDAPCSGNAYQTASGAQVPTSLHQALDAFERSDLALQLLGREVVEHYAHATQLELEAHQLEVTDVELRRGLAGT